MPPLERRLILARLVQAWAETVDRTLLPMDDEVPFLVPSSPADAVGLAADLERLMDALTVEGLPWAEIGGAVEAEYSRYFGLTLDFVKIAAENWPKLLAERGLSDPGLPRSRRLVLAEERRLTRERARRIPVIVAGSTGSVPATARLIAAVAALPRGAVVLPGLDLDLDAAGWDAIETGEGVLPRDRPRPPAGGPAPPARAGQPRPRPRARSSPSASPIPARRPGPRCCRRPCARPRPPTPGPHLDPDERAATRRGRPRGARARRGRRRAGGGAGRRHRPARDPRDARRHGGPGHARPRSRRPGRGRTAALGHRRGGFRPGEALAAQPGRAACAAHGRARRRPRRAIWPTRSRPG